MKREVTKPSQSNMEPDEYFAHIFEQVKSEYLVSGEDGNFHKLECFTWNDLSRETQVESDFP